MLKPLKSNRSQRQSTQRKQAATGLLVLTLVLLLGGVGGGAYYAYYKSQNAPQIANEPMPKPKKRALIPEVPVEQAKNVKLGVALSGVTSPLKAGENTSVVIKTNKGAACSIRFTYNGDKTVTDSGLVPKNADEFGVAEWVWTVPGDAKPGVWPADIVCAYEQQSATVRADIEIAEPVAQSTSES